MIEHKCEICGESFECPDDAKGGLFECPHCHEMCDIEFELGPQVEEDTKDIKDELWGFAQFLFSLVISGVVAIGIVLLAKDNLDERGRLTLFAVSGIVMVIISNIVARSGPK